jgi:hypothetical protein
VQLFLCGLACEWCGVACVLFAALGALLAGVAGLIAHTAGLSTRRLWSRRRYAALAAAGAGALVVVGVPVWVFLRSLPAFNTTTMDAEALQPFIAAMDEVDRASLGFTDIPDDAMVVIGGGAPPGFGYDAALQIYGDTRRTVFFEQEDGSYRWAGEQEIHTGPHQYDSQDGVYSEEISITYDTVDHFGAWLPLNTVHIRYEGDDPRLRNKSNLTLEDVAPILEEWRALRSPTPGSPP